MKGSLEDVTTSNEEKFSVNGMQALRIEVEGKTKAFGFPRYTYVLTLLEAPKELIVINAWSPSEDFVKNKDVLRQLVVDIRGLNEPEAVILGKEGSPPEISNIVEKGSVAAPP